jgi:Na+-driven multidrug efflux pump
VRLTLSKTRVQTSPNQMTEEEKLLGEYPPFQSVLRLSIGPLIPQIVISCYGLFDSIWISHTIGDDGLAVLGAVFIVSFLPMAVVAYISTSISIQTSYLFGKKRQSECSQLFVDFLRIDLFLGILIPAFILPISRPWIKWFDSSEHISLLCFSYLIPSTTDCVFNLICMTCCRTVQSEDHSVLFGLTEISSLVLSVGCFEPIFLLWLRFGIWGASLATILSQTIPGIVLLIFIWRGRFVLQSKFKMVFSKFSPETLVALKVGFANLISNLSITLPLVLMQKYLMNAALKTDEYQQQLEIWAVGDLSNLWWNSSCFFSWNISINFICFWSKEVQKTNSCFAILLFHLFFNLFSFLCLHYSFSKNARFFLV